MSTVLNPATLGDPVLYLFARWRDDPGGTYQTGDDFQRAVRTRRCSRTAGNTLFGGCNALAAGLAVVLGHYPPKLHQPRSWE